MRTINVLAMQRTSAADRTRIEAVDPAIKFIDAGGWFDGEIRDTWPAFVRHATWRQVLYGTGTREERDRLLADAEVILGGWPFPSICAPGRQSSNGFTNARRAPAICSGAICGAVT